MKEIFQVCYAFLMLVCALVVIPSVVIVGCIYGAIVVTYGWITDFIPYMLKDILYGMRKS